MNDATRRDGGSGGGSEGAKVGERRVAGGGGGGWGMARDQKPRACRISLDNGINWIGIGRAVVSRYSITEAAIVFRGL